MRQKVRRIILFIMLLIFPLTLNYFSPYVSIDGAMNGIISGSVLMFFFMLLTGIFFGRAWCSYICPAAGLGEIGQLIKNKRVPVKRLRVIRYIIFTIWFLILISGFVMVGGIKGVNPLHLTENFISVDQPAKFVIYYGVVFLFFILNITIGRRGACHTICWMSPFLVAGTALGRLLRLPQLGVKSNPELCIECKKCNDKCPMSIDVISYVIEGKVKSYDCITCGECIDTCPKKVLGLKWR